MSDFINAVSQYVMGSFFSIFMLGVLTAWLVEGLFYYFFWKNHESDVVSVKPSDASPEDVIKMETAQTNPIKPEQQVMTSKNDVKDKAIEEDIPLSGEQIDAVTQQKKEAVENPTHTAEQKTQNQRAEKPTKTVHHSSERSAVEKPISNPKRKIIKPTVKNDLTQLLGIGAGLSTRLNEIGICSFKQLSQLSAEELIEQLMAKGARLNNKSIMTSWARQAMFADKGDIEGLKAFQKTLKKG